MNAGSSVKPRKVQVKDKGLMAECWDFGGWVAKFDVLKVNMFSWNLVFSSQDYRSFVYQSPDRCRELFKLCPHEFPYRTLNRSNGLKFRITIGFFL